MRIKRYRNLIQAKTRKRLKITRLRNRIRELLKELSLTDLYKLYDSIDDDEFRRRIEDTIIERAFSPDDLLEIIEKEFGVLQKKSFQELVSRIEQGHIYEEKAKEALFKIIERVISLRKDALNVLKRLEMAQEDFKKLFDLTSLLSTSWPEFEQEVAKLQRKKRKKTKKSSVEKVKKAINQLTKLKEKGQR